ncbi:MAG: hypothetical protein ACOX6T_18540 [Myxococcales bacterium]
MADAPKRSAAPRGPQPRLGEILVRAQVITSAQLQTALAEQQKWGGRLGRHLVDLGFLDERTMSLALSRQLGMPCIDLSATQLPPDVTELLSIQVCERLGVMPVGADATRRVLRLATSDPTNQAVLEEVARHTEYTVEPVIAGAYDIDRAIRRYYYGEARESARPAIPGFTPTDQRVDQPPAALAAPPSPPAQTLSPRLDALTARLERLEELATHQTRALRVLVEMLVDAGLIEREAFQKRARGE